MERSFPLGFIFIFLITSFPTSTNGVGGGEFAKEGEFPHAVQLFHKILGTYFCGGSIIAPNVILTAAHCLNSNQIFQSGEMPADWIIVRGGNLKLNVNGTSGKEEDEQIRFVTRYSVHPNYPRFADFPHEHDIALLILKTAFNFTTKVNRIQLPSSPNEIYSRGVIAGWGSCGEKENGLRYLTKTTVSFMGKEMCKFRRDFWCPQIPSDLLICSRTGNGASVCSGDSGSALLCQDGWTIVDEIYGKKMSIPVFCGVSSWGSKDQPIAAFTDVRRYVEWINTAMEMEGVVGSWKSNKNFTRAIENEETPAESDSKEISSSSQVSCHNTLWELYVCASSLPLYERSGCVEEYQICDGTKDCFNGIDESETCCGRGGPVPSLEKKENATDFKTPEVDKNETRMDGSELANLEDFPYAVQLSFTINGKFFCGGSILEPNVVITAGNCFYWNYHWMEERDIPAEWILVTAGSVQVQENGEIVKEEGEQIRKVARIVLHPEFSGSWRRNDIALVILETPFNFTERINKIHLPSTANQSFVSGTLAGWDLIEKGKVSPNVGLHKMDVDFGERDPCKAGLDKDDICSQFKLNLDLYPGETGSPIVCQEDSNQNSVAKNNSSEVLCGIASWKWAYTRPEINCDAFTDIPKYLCWIHETMEKEGFPSSSNFLGNCSGQVWNCEVKAATNESLIFEGESGGNQTEEVEFDEEKKDDLEIKALENNEEYNFPNCSEEFFDCGVEAKLVRCIPKEKACDGYQDCENGEDEILCGEKIESIPSSNLEKPLEGKDVAGLDSEHVTLNFFEEILKNLEGDCKQSGGYFDCRILGTIQCIPEGLLCNGVEECLNGLDEFEALCKAKDGSTISPPLDNSSEATAAEKVGKGAQKGNDLESEKTCAAFKIWIWFVIILSAGIGVILFFKRKIVKPINYLV